MPAYWIARSRITDPVEYKKYTDRVPGIFKKYGGKVLARGGKYRIMEGPETFHRFSGGRILLFLRRQQNALSHPSMSRRRLFAVRVLARWKTSLSKAEKPR